LLLAQFLLIARRKTKTFSPEEFSLFLFSFSFSRSLFPVAVAAILDWQYYPFYSYYPAAIHAMLRLFHFTIVFDFEED
jgi:hypothetical protein